MDHFKFIFLLALTIKSKFIFKAEILLFQLFKIAN